MSFNLTLTKEEYITVCFLMDDYQSILTQEGRKKEAEAVRSFLKSIEEKGETGNSFDESVHKFSVDNSNFG